MRDIDPLVGVCGLVALSVYLLQGFDGLLTRDLGVYAYGGQQVAEGVPPFVAILNRAGPLAHLVPGIGAAAARIVGVDDMLGMRVTLMLVAVVTVMVAYLLARDLFGSRTAGLASAAALLCFEGFLTYATFGPREKTTMVCFLALALLAMVHQRWGTAGAMIALSTLTWQPVFLPAFVGVAVAALLGAGDGWKGRLVALTRIAVGGLIPTAITVAAYAAVGRLQIFLDAFVLINLRYTTMNALGSNLAERLDHHEPRVRLEPRGAGPRHADHPRHRVSTPPSGPPARPPRGRRWSASASSSWGASCGRTGHSTVGRTRSSCCPRRPSGSAASSRCSASTVPVRAVTAGTVAWCLVATGMSIGAAIGNRTDDLDRQRADVEMVLSMLPAPASIISVKAPQALVLSRQRNPSRLQLFGHGLVGYVEDTWPGGIEGYGRVDRQEIPHRDSGRLHRGRTPCCPDWLEDVLKQRYQKVGATAGPFRMVHQQARSEADSRRDRDEAACAMNRPLPGQRDSRRAPGCVPPRPVL